MPFSSAVSTLRQQYLETRKSYEAAVTSSTLSILDAHHFFQQMDKVFSLAQITVEDFVGVLKARWELIRGSCLAYPYDRANPVNIFCLELARTLAPFIEKTTYQLLMPRLVMTENPATTSKLEELSLAEFILADNDEEYIEVFSTLEQALSEMDAKLRRYDMKTKRVVYLTENEKNRLIHHSTETEDFYETVKTLFYLKNNNGSLGSHLYYLMRQLYLGSNNVKQGGSGEENKAGVDSFEGIINFRTFLQNLCEEERLQILNAKESPTEKETFGELWAQWTLVVQAEELASIYCSNTIASKVGDILDANPDLYNIQPRFERKDEATLKVIEEKLTVRIDSLMLASDEAKETLAQALKQDTCTTNSSSQGKNNQGLESQLLFLSECSTAQEKKSLLLKLRALTADQEQFRLELQALHPSNQLALLKLLGIDELWSVMKVDFQFLTTTILTSLDAMNRFAFLELLGSLRVKELLKKDIYRLEGLLECLTASGTREVGRFIFSLKKDLADFFHTGSDLIRIVEYLQPEDQSRLFVQLAANLPTLFRYKHDLLKLIALLQPAPLCHLLGLIKPELALMMNNASQLQSLLTPFSEEKQLIILDQFSSEELTTILKQNTTNQQELMKKLDLFKACPAVYKRLLEATLVLEEVKEQAVSCLGLFAKPNKRFAAMNILKEVLRGREKESALLAHQKEFKKGTLGEVYQRWVAIAH